VIEMQLKTSKKLHRNLINRVDACAACLILEEERLFLNCFEEFLLSS
jgi:hypothetical protein